MGPRHAALEKGEGHVRKSPRHPAEHQGLAQRSHQVSEHPEVVVDVAGGRGDHPGAGGEGAVEGDGVAEGPSPLPDGVVVEGAVQAEGVPPVGLARPQRGNAVDRTLDRPEHAFGETDDLEADGPAVLQLGDRLLGGVHGDQARHRQPVDVGGVGVGVELVESPADAPAQLVVLHGALREAVGGVDDGIVQTELFHAVVEQAGKHRRRPGAGVVGCAPPGALGDAGGAHGRIAERRRVPADDRPLPAELLEPGRTQGFPQVREHGRKQLDGVSVGVDDGMVEFPAYGCRP